MQQYLLWLMGVYFGWQSWGERDCMACTLEEEKKNPQDTSALQSGWLLLLFAGVSSTSCVS